MKLPNRIFCSLAASVICLTFSWSASAGPKAEVMHWNVDGMQRRALVFAPAKPTNSGKAPLLFAFHGHGDNMDSFAEGTGFSTVWPEAVVVYMQGLPTDAFDPEGYGWIYKPKPDGDRDLKFFDAVLQTMKMKFPVDDRRIYATGFSNGGTFTYELWDSRANVFAAFAAVAGRIVPAVHLTQPKPILIIAGQQDRTVPFPDQLEAMKTARELDGTAADGSSCGTDCTMYSSSKSAPVITYIHDGGHQYPAAATKLIVKFFQSHSLN